ncbi:hypothetical protein ACSCB1_11310 [Streptomyces europaeiscabiei]|uniref:hypothetical protein n=1 Tax=Streptomyces europaeiscabiei TaxID=146819 RepID=UPI0006284FDC|nr:hypothetical protein [Streptomyces europaeiscabiei]
MHHVGSTADEPFGFLGAQTREDLLLQVHRTSTTIVFVAHDIDESVYVGDRVVARSTGPASHVLLDVPVRLPPGGTRPRQAHTACRRQPPCGRWWGGR